MILLNNSFYVKRCEVVIFPRGIVQHKIFFFFQTGCSHVIPEVGQTFARLEHYRIHEYAKVAVGKNYRLQSAAGAASRVEDLAHRRRGRPPKLSLIHI